VKARRLLLHGLGHVGRRLLGLLVDRGREFESRYGLRLGVTAATDSTGTTHREDGLDLSALLDWKHKGRGVATFPGGRSALTAKELLTRHAADVVLEATPTNLSSGEPGLSVAQAALKAGMPVVLASKGPLVVAFDRLVALSDRAAPSRPAMRFSGAVGGGMPSINVGRRDLAGTRITRVEAVLNLTSQLLLARMAEGEPLESCLAEARARCIVEADASLDVDGLDAAAKLVILANAVLDQPTKLADVEIEDARGAAGPGGPRGRSLPPQRAADGARSRAPLCASATRRARGSLRVRPARGRRSSLDRRWSEGHRGGHAPRFD
jgi:homoserine dehydrogenase